MRADHRIGVFDPHGVEVAASKPAPKPEDGWTRARLIPTTGIGGQDDQEQQEHGSRG